MPFFHPTDPPKSKPRWFQFSLRTLMVFVTLCAVACSWLAVKMEQARKQREAVEAIRKEGGDAIYDYQQEEVCLSLPLPPRPAPAWLRRIGGDELLGNVTCVIITEDKSIDHLTALPRLQCLLLGGPNITDAALKHLNDLSDLQLVGVNSTSVTDDGLACLAHLASVEELILHNNNITDAGLHHLKHLNHLRRLHLGVNRATEDGVKKLQQALPNCKIER
jgi:hypothetical protein